MDSKESKGVNMAWYKRCEMQGFAFKKDKETLCVCDLTGKVVLKKDCRHKDCYRPRKEKKDGK